MGEQQFSLWCSQVGIVANKSCNDRTGWDYLVEFPANKLNDKSDILTWDQVPPPFECRVQIKSNDKKEGKGKASVKLDNVVRLVNASIPVFILFIEYGGTLSPINAYLVHLNEDIIARTLKRLREYSNNNIKLHEKTINIIYNGKDRIQKLDGEGLKDAICKHIPDGMTNYIRHKMEVVNNIGFIGSGDEITANIISRTNPHELLVDYLIGIQDKLELANIKGINIRFGIPAPKPFIEAKSATLSHSKERKPDSSGKIRIRKDKYSSPISLNADVYFPGWIIHYAPEEFIKFRFVTGLFEFIISPFNQEIVTVYPKYLHSNSLLQLQELKNFLNILDISSESAESDSSFYIEASVKEINICKCYLTANTESYEACKKEKELAEYAWKIAIQYDIQNDVYISLDHLFRQEDRLKLFNRLLESKCKILTITNHLKTLRNDNVALKGVPIIADISLGNFYLIIAVAAIGIPNIDKNEDKNEVKYTFKTPTIEIVNKYIFDDVNKNNMAKSDYESEVIKYLENKCIDVLLQY